jgi:hypothetical protein
MVSVWRRADMMMIDDDDTPNLCMVQQAEGWQLEVEILKDTIFESWGNGEVPFRALFMRIHANTHFG